MEGLILKISKPNKIRIVGFLVLILLMGGALALPIDAKPEKITIGPYNVRFDLGNVGAYSINTTEQLEMDTFLGILITRYYVTIAGRETSEREYIPSSELTINDLHEAMRADVKGIAEDALGSSFPSCGEPTTRGKKAHLA